MKKTLFQNKKSAGFTLVELLVSISIIAVLTALLTANFVGARQRGRDGQRKANAYNLQSALELYRADIGAYPTTMPACGSPLSSSGGTVYMQKVPCDPSSTSSGYTYTSDGMTYRIITCLENSEDSDKATAAEMAGVTDPCTTGGRVPFMLINP